MKIIIIGAGSVGAALAKSLVEENHEVTVIDSRKENLEELSRQCDLRVVCGTPCYPEVLFEAGAQDADMLAAVSASDEQNIIACQIASSLYHIPTKVARIRSEAYLVEKDELFKPDAIDIDEVISPEYLVSHHIVKIIEYPGAKSLFEFADMHVSLIQVTAFYGGSLVGNQLSTVRDLLNNVDVNFVGIFRNGKSLQILPGTVIEAGDDVYFITDTSHIREVMSLLQNLENPYRRIMIYGGGVIGYSLARELEKKYRVKLIESNRELAEHLAQELTNTMVLHEENSLQELFESEQIDKTDFFIAVSSDDKNNITSAMMAASMGAKKTGVTIQHKEFLGVCSQNIDVTISPELSTLSALLTFIRHAEIKQVYSMRLGLSEAMEIIVHGTSGSSLLVGKKVSEVKLPQGTSICALMHNGISHINCNDHIIEDGDTMVIFLTNKNHIKEIEKLVQPGEA